MCRSKANGGRRCNGHTTTAARQAGPAAPASAAPVSTSTGGGPSRQRTDQLAAALPADRTGWDGKPLDAVGRRLYALRESGYRGPIGQDGYPDTTSEGAATLRRMAQHSGEHVDW